MRRTTIYLGERHFAWRRRHPVNLAEFVRMAIDAEIEKEGKTVKRYFITDWLADRRGIPAEFKGVEIEARGKAICVDPLDLAAGEIWIPRSQLEETELVGLYREEVEYPE